MADIFNDGGIPHGFPILEIGDEEYVVNSLTPTDEVRVTNRNDGTGKHNGGFAVQGPIGFSAECQLADAEQPLPTKGAPFTAKVFGEATAQPYKVVTAIPSYGEGATTFTLTAQMMVNS